MVLIPSLYNRPKVQEKLSNTKMFVVKRDGRKEPVMFDKITSRIQKLCYGLDIDYIDPPSVTLKVISGLYSGVSTVELDNLAAETAVMLSNEHPHYAVLAARIETSNLHKETKKSFSEVVEDLYKAGEEDGFIHPKMNINFYNIIRRNEEVLNSSIIYDRDFSYSYFAIKTLENDFLKKVSGKVVERPQHMLMRIAIAVHGGEDIDLVIDTYNKLSMKLYTHSPSAMRSAGFIHRQMLSDSCLTMKSDSIEGIFDTLKDFGQLARADLTVGLNVHCIRSKGAYIAGTNGKSNGLIPLLRVYNSKVKGTMTRSGDTANLTIYLEPWHADIFDFIALKKTTGKHEQRARELSYALWIPDLFMKRVREDSDWCLMSPNDSEELESLWGDAFEEQYIKFEKEERYMRKVKARQVWNVIYESQMETGGPSMFYKDNCNRKSNHENVGTLLSSSHSGEIMAFTTSNEIPVCGAGVLCLNLFVKPERKFDFDLLKECVKNVTRTLDKMIDVTEYPNEESRATSRKHRPISIGVQGLADTFILMRCSYESEEAKLLNKQIFETIYYGAMEASYELAKKLGPYATYKGSPVSKGVFQYDMWAVTPTALHDWTSLKKKVAKFGVRNSVLIACAPSPVNALIQGCSEGTEPLFSNFQKRDVFEGNIKVVNRHLLNDLMELGLWDNEMEAAIKENDGSVQDIDRIPDDLKKLYKTRWEILQKAVLELAADRGAFIDQSQALTVCVVDPNYGKFSSMHFFAWKSGLKTGMTNFLTKTSSASASTSSKEVQTSEVVASGTQNGTHRKDADVSEENLAALVCSLDNREDCLVCGS